MSIPPTIEMELASMAAAADRANRPVSLLSIPLLLVVASLLFAAFAYRGLAVQRSLVVHRQAQAARVYELVRQIELEQKKTVDLDRLYPPAPFFGSQVADDVWKKPDFAFREPPNVGSLISTRADALSQVYRSDVTVTVANEPLEKIFRATDAVLNHPHLDGRPFISQVMLTPTGTGWRATVRFSVYEKK